MFKQDNIKNLIDLAGSLNKIKNRLFILESSNKKDGNLYLKYLNDYRNTLEKFSNEIITITNKDVITTLKLIENIGFIMPEDKSLYDHNVMDVITNNVSNYPFKKLVYYLIDVLNTNPDFITMLTNNTNKDDISETQRFVLKYTNDSLLIFLAILESYRNNIDNKTIKNSLLQTKYNISYIVPCVELNMLNNNFNVDENLLNNIDYYSVEECKQILSHDEIIIIIKKLLTRNYDEATKIRLISYLRSHLAMITDESIISILNNDELKEIVKNSNQKKKDELIKVYEYTKNDRLLFNRGK